MLNTEFEKFGHLLLTLGDKHNRFSKKKFLGEKASTVFNSSDGQPHIYSNIEGLKPLLFAHFKDDLDAFERKLTSNNPIHSLEPLDHSELIDELIDIALKGIESGETSFKELNLCAERNPYRAAIKLISWSLPISIKFIEEV